MRVGNALRWHLDLHDSKAYCLLEMVEKFGKYRFRFDVSKFSREVVADEYAGLYGKILSRGANKDNMKAQNE